MVYSHFTDTLTQLIVNCILYVIYFVINVLLICSIVYIIKKIPKLYKNYQETTSESDKDSYAILLFGYCVFFPMLLLFIIPSPNIQNQTKTTELHPGQYTMDQYGTLMMYPDNTKEPINVDVYYKNRITNEDIPHEYKSLRIYKTTYVLKNKKEIDIYKTEEFDTRSSSGKNEIDWKNVDG